MHCINQPFSLPLSLSVLTAPVCRQVVQTAHPYEVVHQCVPMVPKVEEIAEGDELAEGEGEEDDYDNGSGSDGSGGLQEDTESTHDS